MVETLILAIYWRFSFCSFPVFVNTLSSIAFPRDVLGSNTNKINMTRKPEKAQKGIRQDPTETVGRLKRDIKESYISLPSLFP